MKHKSLIVVSLTFALLITACAGARSEQVLNEPASAPDVEMMDKAGFDADSEARFAVFGEASPIEPMVIRNASLNLVVEDPSRSADDIGKMAEDFGGFVVSSSVFLSSSNTSSKTATRASVSVRVPVERLDEAIERIVADAIEVRDKRINGEDVTQQYTDLQSRLRSLEAAEEQLLAIMESATETEDVLQVYNDVRQVQEQIEVIKGQINYFEDSARLSLITVELIPDELAQPIEIGGWRPEGTAKQAVELLVQTLQSLGNIAIWLVIYLLPIALILGIPGVIIGRRIRKWRRLRRERSQKSIAEEAE